MSDERCLPGSVRGPVECSEFARLMAARSRGAVAGDDMIGSHNRDSIGVRRSLGESVGDC
jgi:hypothetical protein